MLLSLYIKNFTIVDDLNIDLSTGFTAITGETGAGKSIMIDALSLTLGARADSQLIREGQEQCDIHAIFDITTIREAKSWLQENELAQNDECQLRRTLHKDGRSRCTINDNPCTLQKTRELAALLVNIHGQHEHQNLLKREAHRTLIDNYAAHTKLRDTVSNLYHSWHEKQQLLQSILDKTTDKGRYELLRYQVQELDQLSLTLEELKQLEQDHKTQSNADQLSKDSHHALAFIDNTNTSALNQNQQALQLLQAHSALSPEIKSTCQLLEQANIQLQEARDELSHFVEHLVMDEEQLKHLESRLLMIDNIARKHRIKAKELPNLHQTLSDELALHEQSDSLVQELQTVIDKLAADYHTAAKLLTQSRQKAAKQLAKIITQSMQKLAIVDGKFNVASDVVNH